MRRRETPRAVTANEQQADRDRKAPWANQQRDSTRSAGSWREYNEEQPKKGLGGLTPAAYARRLMKETGTVTAGL